MTDAHFIHPGGLNQAGNTPLAYATNQTTQFVENIAGHAVVGCASGAATGQGCGTGAAAAAVADAATPLYATSVPGLSAGTAAAIGGATAAITGGKAGQGAVLGAYGYLFNEMGVAAGGGIIGGKNDSFGAANLSFGLVFSDWDPRSWGVFGQISLSDTSGPGAYAGAGANLGGWYSGTSTPSGDSGWVQSTEKDANAGLGASVGGSLNFTPDTKDGYGSISATKGLKLGVGIGAQASSGTAQTRSWVWRPFGN